MASFNARRLDGPPTYEALTNIVGGQLVVPQAGATSDPSLAGIQPAGDAAVNCLGVAAQDCITVANRAALETGGVTGYGGGWNVTDVSVPGATTAVYEETEGYLTYSAACAHGAKLACAANGAVRPWVSGDGAAALIGHCSQPGGVSAAGVALGKIRIR
jgi:hypothetical protein